VKVPRAAVSKLLKSEERIRSCNLQLSLKSRIQQLRVISWIVFEAA
jgi:hypothetical protein